MLRSIIHRIKARVRSALISIVREAIGIERRGELFNLAEEQQRLALASSARYVSTHMANARRVQEKFTLLSFGMEQVQLGGLFLEFGVASGDTINCIASRTSQKVYGFDSFEGLPEDWTGQLPKGAFKQSHLPNVRANVELVIGLFDHTISDFLRYHPEPVAFIHIDCDLYSSTKCVFENLGDRIRSGTIIVFDEYLNYSGWQKGERKAFYEFLEAQGLTHVYIGYTDSQQVAVKIN